MGNWSQAYEQNLSIRDVRLSDDDVYEMLRKHPAFIISLNTNVQGYRAFKDSPFFKQFSDLSEATFSSTKEFFTALGENPTCGLIPDSILAKYGEKVPIGDVHRSEQSWLAQRNRFSTAYTDVSRILRIHLANSEVLNGMDSSDIAEILSFIKVEYRRISNDESGVFEAQTVALERFRNSFRAEHFENYGYTKLPSVLHQLHELGVKLTPECFEAAVDAGAPSYAFGSILSYLPGNHRWFRLFEYGFQKLVERAAVSESDRLESTAPSFVSHAIGLTRDVTKLDSDGRAELARLIMKYDLPGECLETCLRYSPNNNMAIDEGYFQRHADNGEFSEINSVAIKARISAHQIYKSIERFGESLFSHAPESYPGVKPGYLLGALYAYYKSRGSQENPLHSIVKNARWVQNGQTIAPFGKINSEFLTDAASYMASTGTLTSARAKLILGLCARQGGPLVLKDAFASLPRQMQTDKCRAELCLRLGTAEFVDEIGDKKLRMKVIRSVSAGMSF